MEQHSIPRQITSFEFKLIGFMTLKQFLYLVIFGPLGYIVYIIFPIPLINILLGIAVGAFGVALAFVPINDRPLEIWLRNIWKRLTSPTQYMYHKHNSPISVFQNLYYVSDPHHVMAHIESQKMLAAYLVKTRQTMQPSPHKKQVQHFFQMPGLSQNIIPPTQTQETKPRTATQTFADYASPIKPQETGAPQTTTRQPFFIGSIKNNRKIPLSGILVYVKNSQNVPVRLLKTNPHGIFATFSPLTAGEYTFEIKDPKNTYFFDTMKITIQDVNTKPFDIFSKELL